MEALVADLWKRRHALTNDEWLEAAPVMLGLLVAQWPEAPTPDTRRMVETGTGSMRSTGSGLPRKGSSE